MNKLVLGFTCLYSAALIFVGVRSSAQAARPIPQIKKEDPTAGSFTLLNKTGVYTTATPRSVTIKGVTPSLIFSKQKPEAAQEIVSGLKDQAVSSDTDNPTEISRVVVGLQLKIGNRMYLAKIHNIPQNTVLEIVDRGMGYTIQSPKDAQIKIRPINLRYSKGRTQMLKQGIDIPDLPPEIFSIRRMKIPGLNPLGN